LLYVAITHPNIESYGRRLLVGTLSGILQSSHIISIYWNLASVGSSLCMHSGLLKADLKKI